MGFESRPLASEPVPQTPAEGRGLKAMMLLSCATHDAFKGAFSRGADPCKGPLGNKKKIPECTNLTFPALS